MSSSVAALSTSASSAPSPRRTCRCDLFDEAGLTSFADMTPSTHEISCAGSVQATHFASLGTDIVASPLMSGAKRQVG